MEENLDIIERLEEQFNEAAVIIEAIEEIKRLRATSIPMKHGSTMECPSCGAPGRFDNDNTSKEAVFPDSIWYNCHSGWECCECWLK